VELNTPGHFSRALARRRRRNPRVHNLPETAPWSAEGKEKPANSNGPPVSPRTRPTRQFALHQSVVERATAWAIFIYRKNRPPNFNSHEPQPTDYVIRRSRGTRRPRPRDPNQVHTTRHFSSPPFPGPRSTKSASSAAHMVRKGASGRL